MNTLVDMISGMDVKEDDENYKNAVDYMFDGLAKRKPDCFAVKQYRKYKLSSGKTAKSILISCGARLAPFDIPQLREIMSYDELELDRMGDKRTATFFVISDTTQTYNFIVALAFSQMFNLLCERADNVHGGRLPHHVRVLWDEAANTGQVPQLEKLVAVIRSREISLALLYQAQSQCKAIYKDNAETIFGNMDTMIFLGGRESTTIKEISENWLGKATISMQTEGRSRGQSESFSQNTQRLGRELMTPSELATMPGDRCILQLRGLPPFYSKKYDLKQHPNYKYTAEADKRNAFDLQSLVTRRMDKLNPNEQYTVYEVAVPDEAHMEEDEDILNYDDLDDPDTFVYLRENPPQGHSLEYADCRLSLLSAQKGKCSVSGELFLNPDNIVCHMKVPKEQGGHERYSNLVLLHRRYLPLLTDQDTAALKSMCKQLTVTKKQLTKINSLRTAAKLVAI